MDNFDNNLNNDSAFYNNEIKTTEELKESSETPIKNEEREGGYFGYYLFIIFTSIIGFVFAFLATRFVIDEAANRGIIDLVEHKLSLPVVVSIVAVVIFAIIAVNFKKLLKKIFLSELFLYLYCGFLTTVVNIVTFKLFLNRFGNDASEGNLGWKVAEVIAFIVAVVFAFIADKIFVFKSHSFAPSKFFSELGMFLGARLLTEAINFTIMYVMIDKMNIAEFTTKLFAAVIVIIINYLLSKFIVFKKKKKIENESK